MAAETICNDCEHYRPTHGVLYVCTRYPGLATDGLHECDDFEPDRAASRWVKTERVVSVRELIRQECNALREMLLEKNAKYGNSALEPIRCFSRAPADEQIRIRLDDKLSRLMRGNGQEDEDVEQDLMGYLVLLRVARRMNREGGV